MKIFSHPFNLVAAATLCLAALSSSACRSSSSGDSGKPIVVATTTMVGDLVQAIGGDDIQLETLMRPGVDPHLFQAAPSDVTKMNRAKAIFYSGLLLEGRLSDILVRMEKQGKTVHAVTAAVPEEGLFHPPGSDDHPDPHVWGDVSLWILCMEPIVKGLSEILPEHSDEFRARAEAYKEQLQALDQWAKERVATLPEAQRKLVTSHDAFNYFGRAYGLTVMGVQGISTQSEASLMDRTEMTKFIRENGIRAIFVESSVSPGLIQEIAKDAGVSIGGELFSDAMGEPGVMEEGAGESYDVGTYPGMIKHNINTIVDALQ